MSSTSTRSGSASRSDLPVTPLYIATETELRSLPEPPAAEYTLADLAIQIYCEPTSLWIIVSRAGTPGVAFRALYTPDGTLGIEDVKGQEFRLRSGIGSFRVRIELTNDDAPIVHWTTWLLPTEELLLPFAPRDIHPLGPGRVLEPNGALHFSQDGPAAGLLFLAPALEAGGSLLYLQNFTSLNRFFEQTHTSPTEAVGGDGAELGFALPASTRPLRPDEEVCISDGFVAFTPEVPDTQAGRARLFMDLLAALYLQLPRPAPRYHDWPWLVRRSLADLVHSPAAGTDVEGQRFLRSYAWASKYPPESMVQLAVLIPLLEYQDWANEKTPLADELIAGLGDFFDEERGMVVRWRVGDRSGLDGDQPHANPGVMDSWYLFHPLLNLAQLAARGNAEAKMLFIRSLDFIVHAAHHFDYRWPVMHDMDTLAPTAQESRPDLRRELDVAGLYASVMLLARDLTGDARYFDEAVRAARSLEGVGFDMLYQANNTTFGAGALTRLFAETGDALFRDLADVCLAALFARMWLWDCDYGVARHYSTFFGVEPVQRAPYIAAYEQAEVSAGLQEYLRAAGEGARPSVRLLVAELVRYSLDLGWYFYPHALPAAILHEQTDAAARETNGWIERELALPLEDLYDGWQKPGKVGQEVYGAGSCFALVVRAYHNVPDDRFWLYCDYPLEVRAVASRAARKARRRSIALRVLGDSRGTCRLRLVPRGPDRVPEAALEWGPRHKDPGALTVEGHREWMVPGDTRCVFRWGAGP